MTLHFQWRILMLVCHNKRANVSTRYVIPISICECNTHAPNYVIICKKSNLIVIIAMSEARLFGATTMSRPVLLLLFLAWPIFSGPFCSGLFWRNFIKMIFSLLFSMNFNFKRLARLYSESNSNISYRRITRYS